MSELAAQREPCKLLLEAILTELKRLNGKNWSGVSPDSTYLTLKEAATYARYQTKPFSRLVREDQIPRCCRGNRFRKVDIDQWMDDPNHFKNEAVSRKKGKYSENPMAVIANMLQTMTSDAEWTAFRENLKGKTSDDEWEAMPAKIEPALIWRHFNNLYPFFGPPSG